MQAFIQAPTQAQLLRKPLYVKLTANTAYYERRIPWSREFVAFDMFGQ